MATVPVVDLPGVNCRVTTHRFGQATHDLPAFEPIPLMRKTIVAPRTERSGKPVLVERNHIGHGIHQPLGRARRRCSDHRGKTLIFHDFEKSLEPGKVELLRFGLEPAPGKFSYPDEFDPYAAHPAQVLGPASFVPMLRVVTYAQ